MRGWQRVIVEGELLGPVGLTVDGVPVVLGGERQRACLAVLLLAGGRRVPADTLRDELWGEQTLARADASLQMQISRLRRSLADAGLQPSQLAAENGGYVLRIDASRLDSDRVESLVEEARALAHSDDDVAVARLRQALSLYRGIPLADAGDGPHVSAARARLEALRDEATIELIEAQLRRGRHAGLIGELQTLCQAHPFEERLHGLLMLALYRCGRQADALAAYRSLRESLIAELGLEPTPPLRALNDAILRQDAALDLAPATAAPRRDEPTADAQAPPGDVPSARVVSMWRAAALAGLVIAAIAAAGLWLSGAWDASAGLASVSPDKVAIIAAHSGRVVAAVTGVDDPVALAADASRVWIADASSSTITRIDPQRSGALLSIGVNSPSAVAIGAGGVWVLSERARTLQEVSPTAARVVRTVSVGNGPVAVVTGMGSVWVADALDGTVLRIDASSGVIRARIAVGGTPEALAVAAGAVWVADSSSGVLDEVDPDTDRITASVATGSHPEALAVAGGAIWAADGVDGTIARVSPSSGAVTAVLPIGTGGPVLTSGTQTLWVDGPQPGVLSRISATTATVTGQVRLGSAAAALAVAGDRVLAATTEAPAARRGGTLYVVGLRSTPLAAMADPDATYDQDAWQLQALTNDGLVAARKVGGAAGAQIVPDLAAALPVVSDSGRTWTFRLRQGLRYSTGQPVRASDVRASFERLERVGAQARVIPALPALGLIGEAGCRAKPRSCDLSRGVLADDRDGTVVLHLTAPAPDLLTRLSTPPYFVLPAGTPPRALTRPPIPATGPYEVVRKTSSEVELARNPRFSPWSTSAQPAGLPDRIVWSFAISPQAALGAVLAGRADVLDAGAPPDQANVLLTQHPTQLHVDPVPATEAIFLDVDRVPFTDVRVRQAAAFATDRARLAADEAPPPAESVTCQILPPGMPGFRPYCPYTAAAGTAGSWSGPDLERARSLIRAAGAAGASVTVAAPSDRPSILHVASDFAANLRAIGLRAHVVTRPLAPGTYTRFIADPRSGVQAGWTHWLADGPDPSEFFSGPFTCNGAHDPTGVSGNASRYCSPRVDAAVARAQSTGGGDPASAADEWAAVDEQVTRAAAWIPFATINALDVVSSRAHGYAFNPIYSILLDQISVR